MRDRPNILFISTDQHRGDALSAYGSPWVRTPSLDALHERGVSFLRSYSPDPVCAPARSSWWTGRYTSETGSVFNTAPVHDSIPDLGQILAANGYAAFHTGKWHVDGRPMEKSFRNLYQGARRIEASAGEVYDPAITRSAVSFLSSYDGPEPFFLAVEYVNPHDICEYIHGHETKSLPGPVDLGIVDADDLPPLPGNFDAIGVETGVMRAMRREGDHGVLRASREAVRHWNEEQWRYYLWNYFRLVEKVDTELGLVLRTLGASRFRDDTLVIFTSDHGEGLGSHRLFQKFTLYEESVRVPLIAVPPGALNRRGGRFDRDHLVSGIDLLPTFLDYAGVALPPDARGDSLKPLIEGSTPGAWREHLYAEHSYWGRMLIRGNLKYVTEYLPDSGDDFTPPGPGTNPIGVEQLFDLEADPGETRNLAYDEAYRPRRDSLRSLLAEVERPLIRAPITDTGVRNRITGLANYLRSKRHSADRPV